MEQGVINLWTFFWSVGGEVNRKSASSTFWFQRVWGLCACGRQTVNFFNLVGVCLCKTVQRTWLKILPIVLEEELNVLDFVWWPKYYSFVLLNCFPFYSLSLLWFKSILWLKCSYRQKSSREHGCGGLFWKGLIGSCPVTLRRGQWPAITSPWSPERSPLSLWYWTSLIFRLLSPAWLSVSVIEHLLCIRWHS